MSCAASDRLDAPSGIGRETHKGVPDHSQQTGNMLVSENPDTLGFF